MEYYSSEGLECLSEPNPGTFCFHGLTPQDGKRPSHAHTRKVEFALKHGRLATLVPHPHCLTEALIFEPAAPQHCKQLRSPRVRMSCWKSGDNVILLSRESPNEGLQWDSHEIKFFLSSRTPQQFPIYSAVLINTKEVVIHCDDLTQP